MKRWGYGWVLLVCGACVARVDAHSGVAIRDSAGIRIVEHLEPAGAGKEWRIGERPLLDIGGAAQRGGPALYRVAGVLRLANGRIVVANGGSSSIEIFAPDGAHLRSVGRAGDGPGEFRALSWAGSLEGDTLAAWDSGAARLSLFTAQGELITTVAPRQPLGMYPEAVGILDGNLVLALHRSTLGASSTASVHVERDSVRYAVLARDGSVRILSTLPGTEMLMSGNPAGGLMVMPLPFGLQAISTLTRDRLYLADGERFEISAFDSRALRSRLRSDRPREPVRPEDVHDYASSLVTLGAEGNARLQRQQAQLLAQAPYPKRKPAITALLGDSEGNLWVESPISGPGRNPTRWQVFSREGHRIGSTRIPLPLNLRQAGPNWVLITTLDSDQAEHVQLYPLTRVP